MPEITRFAATVSYDGQEFAGSQRQLHARTVQISSSPASASAAAQAWPTKPVAPVTAVTPPTISHGGDP